MPEVTLGMNPGAGGTQHVPRVVDTAGAIDVVCSGRRIDADEALELGLVDAIADGDVREAATIYAATLTGKRRLRDQAVRQEDVAAVEAACRRVRDTFARAPGFSLSERPAGRPVVFDIVHRHLPPPRFAGHLLVRVSEQPRRTRNDEQRASKPPV